MSAGRLAGLSVCLLTFLLLLALCPGARAAVLWVGGVLLGLVAGAGLILVLLAGLVMVRLPAKQQPSLGEVPDLQPHRNTHLQLCDTNNVGHFFFLAVSFQIVELM
jgi:hypothetical protein